LQATAELPEAALHCSLAHLQAAELLYETRLFPEHEYTFKHALTQEVAYSSLLLERRRILHARLVEALKALAPDRVAEQVERLAHHALRGEVWDKAGTYCQQALELATELGDSALQEQASLRLGQAYYAIGDFDRAAELLRWNVETADRESDRRSTGLRIASQLSRPAPP
jgi:predicted ATPase